MASPNAALDLMFGADRRVGRGRSLHGGVMILDAAFRTVALDGGAEAILAKLDDHADGRRLQIPDSVRSRLQAGPNDGGDAARWYLTAGGAHYCCRVFVLTPPAGGEAMLTVYLKREASVVEAVRRIAFEHRLTDREQQALVGLFNGLTSREVAAEMNISPNTVKAFVRLAMIKAGVTSRAHLFAKLLDAQSS